MKKIALMLSTLAFSVVAAATPEVPAVPHAPAVRVADRGPGAKVKPNKDDKPRKDEGHRKEEREKRRQEMEQKIDTYITVELATQLGLSNEKALKVADVLKSRRESRHAKRDAMTAEYKKLKELVDAKAPDAQIKAQTERTVDAARAMRNEEDVIQETAKFLTTVEQAKLVLAFPHVRKEIKHMMGEAKGKKGRRGPSRGGDRGFGPPDDDD